MPQRFFKEPGTNEDYDFDWNTGLAEGDAVDTYTVTADQGVILGATTLYNNVVKQFVSGGTTGENYRIICRVVTLYGRTQEADIQLVIRESLIPTYLPDEQEEIMSTPVDLTNAVIFPQTDVQWQPLDQPTAGTIFAIKTGNLVTLNLDFQINLLANPLNHIEMILPPGYQGLYGAHHSATMLYQKTLPAPAGVSILGGMYIQSSQANPTLSNDRVGFFPNDFVAFPINILLYIAGQIVYISQ